MQEIEGLGAEIEDAWRAAQWRAEDFAPIAYAALAGRVLPVNLSIDRIFRWFASSPQIPHQPQPATFGEPPIRLYSGRRFYIEALFWMDGTTSIHQHGFSGAFQVLLGGSIHTTYTFERSEVITRALVLGKLTANHSELLRAGDVRSIVSGDRFIHSLFHLERPSVTLVVRTRHDAGTDPQYSYRVPGIAFDPFASDERMSPLLRLLGVLDPRSPDTATLLADVIAHADLGSVVAILMTWFALRPVDPHAAEALLAIVAQRHRALATNLRSALQEARRQALIIHRRRSHHRAEHRFFLALLLNVRDREPILRLVEQQYPGRDPVDRIVGWIEQLTAVQPADPDANGAGRDEYELGEGELKVLRHLLQQRSPDQVVAALHEEYDDIEHQRPEILELCASLASSVLFQPLLRVQP
jgi:hypothetical protein